MWRVWCLTWPWPTCNFLMTFFKGLLVASFRYPACPPRYNHDHSFASSAGRTESALPSAGHVRPNIKSEHGLALPMRGFLQHLACRSGGRLEPSRSIPSWTRASKKSILIVMRQSRQYHWTSFKPSSQLLTSKVRSTISCNCFKITVFGNVGLLRANVTL